MSYLHSPLAGVGYQGLSALEANATDPDFHRAFNDLFQLPSDVVPTGELSTIRLPNISLAVANAFIARTGGGAEAGLTTVVRLKVPYGIADRFPDCYDVCKRVSPFEPVRRDGGPLRVALHVRRGEQAVVESHRMLPNRYYVNVAQGVARVLDALKLDYKIELWTEVPAHDFVVGPDHHGIDKRLEAPRAVSFDMFRLDDFDGLPHLVYRLNGRTIDCLRGLATADILVMSRSSFSYVGAILNRTGVVLYHPFWHSALSSWITVEPDGAFDESRLTEAATGLSG